MTKKRLLVTGGSGQVGGAIGQLASRYGFVATMPGRDTLDLASADDIVAAVAADDWSAIINCAAYTAVDKAQSDAERANAVNRVAPGIFASETARRAIPLIHLSTDYVFDGSKSSPYVEDDPVCPLGVYGASKEAGEAAVRAYNPLHAILRTAWVVSAGGGNFIDTMLRLAGERDEIGVVADQRGNPTSATDIAAAALAIATKMAQGSAVISGTWHFVNSGSATWHDLAALVFAEAAKRGRPVPKLRAITTADYPTPTRRPANSCLDTSKFTRDFGIEPRSWQAAITDIMDERLDNHAQTKARQ